MYFPQAVANHMNIPSISFHCSCASFLLAYSSIRQLEAEGYIPPQDGEETLLRDQVPELQPLEFKDLPISEIGTIEDSLEIIALNTTIRTSEAIIHNIVDFFEHSSLLKLRQKDKVPIFSIGPLHKMAPTSSTSLLKEDTSCLVWLDNQAPNSVIYLSFGSLLTIYKKELEETAWGLANSGHWPTILVVVRPGSVHGSEWIKLLPEGFKEEIGERGLIVKWVPKKEVLAHCAVGGFLSHCGWNSSMESICEGVPLICRPSFGDQKIIARYMTCEWKIGLELEHMLETGKIDRAIRRLMCG